MIFRYKSQLQQTVKLVLPVKGDVTKFTSDRWLSMYKPQVCIGVQWTPLRFNFIITVYGRQGTKFF